MKRKSLPPVPAEIMSLVPYAPGKPLSELERELGITGAIKLASNECPLGPSPKAMAALQAVLPEIHRYPDGAGYELRTALAEIHGLTREHICLGNGSSEIIELLCRTFLRPGDEVLSAAYAFLMYRKITQSHGGLYAETALDARWLVDLEALADRVTPRTRIIFLNNPHNPCGTALNREEVKNFLDRLPGGVLVVMDEAYIDFSEDWVARGTSFLDHETPVLVMRTFSKIAGLAGLRIGYAISQPEIIDLLQRVRAPFNVSIPAQVAALAALKDQAFTEKHKKLVQEGRRQLYEGFSRLGLDYVPSQGNYVLVKVGEKASAGFDALLRKGVIVRSMSSYDMPQYWRISVGLPQENARFLREVEEIFVKM